MSGEVLIRQQLRHSIIMDNLDWQWVGDDTIVINLDQANEAWVTVNQISIGDEVINRSSSMMNNYSYAKGLMVA